MTKFTFDGYKHSLCIPCKNTKSGPRKDKRGVDLISDALPFGRLWYGEPNAVSDAIGCVMHREHFGQFRFILVTQLFGRCFLRSCEKERKTDGVKSIPKSPENVAPFTKGGWPVDALSPGTMRLLRKIADQDGWTLEEVMTAAMEEFVARRKAEKELETKIICFPKR